MRVPALAFALVLASLASCDEVTDDPGTGGIRTAQLRGEMFVADGKLQECTGGATLTEVWQRIHSTPDSLPVTDGWVAKWIAETTDVLGGMLRAKDCDTLLTQLNFGVAPAACTTEGATCAGDVVRDCRKVGDRKLRFDTDCTRTSMTCRNGTCVVGPCASGACDGDTLVACDANREKSLLKCGAVGLTCGTGGEGLQCIGRGVSCTTDDVAPICAEDGKLTFCLGGRVAVVDCGALTDGRRACNQDWLNKHTDVPADDLLASHLADACGPAGTDCYGSASECDGTAYMKLCVDGFYEYEPCRDFRTTGCSWDGVFENYATCKGFPESK